MGNTEILTRVDGPVKESIFKLFEKRSEELESFRRLVTTIKNWIKRYKPTIMKIQLEDVKETETLVKEKRKLEVKIDQSNKQEDVNRMKEINKKLSDLRDRAKDLSVKSFTSLSPEYLELLQKNSDNPNKKVLAPLTNAQQAKWNEIFTLIPKENQVYIQKSISQLKGIQKEYQDWLEEVNAIKREGELDPFDEDQGKVVVKETKLSQ